MSRATNIRKCGAAVLLAVLALTLGLAGARFAVMRTVGAQQPAKAWLTSKERITILSANDGSAHTLLTGKDTGMKVDRQNVTRDSITFIHLGPDHPPIIKTIFGTVPNSIMGPPHIAITDDGHYGFVPSAGRSNLGVEEAADLISVIDLNSPELAVVQKVNVPITQNMITKHPDGQHLIVALKTGGFGVYRIQAGQLVQFQESKSEIVPRSWAVSPKGDRIVAVGRRVSEPASTGRVHMFSYRDGVIDHLGEVQVRPGLPPWVKPGIPGMMRFSPDGRRILVANEPGGGGKGTLDDVLSIDMTQNPPLATEVIPQVCDGIESLAVHPSGRFAVIACLEDQPILFGPTAAVPVVYSHLAVIDLTSKPARLLSHVEIDPIPEGIEFSPDGTQLFVQAAMAHRIIAFDVDGFVLKRSPFTLRVGHAPSSMALSRQYVGRP